MNPTSNESDSANNVYKWVSPWWWGIVTPRSVLPPTHGARFLIPGLYLMLWEPQE